MYDQTTNVDSELEQKVKQKYERLLQSKNIPGTSPKVVWDQPPEWYEPESFERAQKLWKQFKPM